MNLFLVAEVFCSNNNPSATFPITRFSSINNLRTFTLSRDVALDCSVFWPNITGPCPGNVAIGLTFPRYKVSLLVGDNFLSAWIVPPTPPLLNPAGANHSAPNLSFVAYTPGITVEAGTYTNLPVSFDNTWTHGQ